LGDPISKIPNPKRAGRVAQGIGSESKSQYTTTTKPERMSREDNLRWILFKSAVLGNTPGVCSVPLGCIYSFFFFLPWHSLSFSSYFHNFIHDRWIRRSIFESLHYSWNHKFRNW
jgi:hypothetical protein